MFKSTLTKTASGETEELCLFINPTGNTKRADLIFFEISFTSTSNSIWEFYLNPTVTSNGTIQTVVDLEGGVANNTINLYKTPTVTVNTYGNPLRKFIIQSNIKEFSSRVPMITLEPGNYILLRRLNYRKGEIIASFKWKEKAI
jgi:hypothetical protein